MLFFTAPVSMLLHSSKSVQIEQNVFKFQIAPHKHESILNIFFANNQRPPNDFVSMPVSHPPTVMTVCFVAHSHRLSTLSLCLESLRSHREGATVRYIYERETTQGLSQLSLDMIGLVFSDEKIFK
jgi:hypothetical protein